MHQRNRGVTAHLRQEESGSVVDQSVGGVNLRHERYGENYKTAVGYVVSHIAGTYTYLVDIHGRRVWATDMPSSVNVLGARTYSTYSPGSWVVIWLWSALDTVGYIVGASPEKNDQEFEMLSSLRVQGSPSGYMKESVHKYIPDYMAAADERYEMDNLSFSYGRPLDVLTGDWGVVNEFDVGIDVRKLNAGLYGGGASFVTSYVDDTARITGQTIIEESWTTRRRQFCDQGEGSEIYEMTQSLHEGLGVANALSTAPSTTNEESKLEDKDAQTEPLSWDQQAIYRYLRMSGWLGDLVHGYVISPKTLPGNALAQSSKRSPGLNWPGLAEFHVGSDGFIAVRTAKGLLLQKTNSIPVPEELREPHDPKGDKDTEVYQSTAQKTDYVWGTDEPMARPQLLSDHNAFKSTLGGNINTLEHQKDWRVPDATESAIGSATETYVPLTDKFRKDIVTPTEITSGRRTTKYYQSISTILMTDDGGIIFEDGYGSVYSMTGGNIEISPPGDIIMRPGRRFVVMAPHDAIIRSGRNVDVSAATGDVRVKAERNLHMLAGNSSEGVGGILFESRSTAGTDDFSQGQDAKTYGIMFKSERSPVKFWSNDIYMRAISSGKVVLDAGAGAGAVTITGGTIDNYATTRVSNTVGLMPGSTSKPETASYWSQTVSNVFGQVGSTSMKLSGGSVSFIGKENNTTASLFVDGSVTSRSYAGTNEHIGTITDSAIRMQAVNDRNTINPGVSAVSDAVAPFLTSVYDTGGWGARTTYEKASFSFNTSSAFGTSDSTFKLFEMPWQARNKAANATTNWNEPEVSFGTGGKSMPWPGREAWNGNTYGVTNTALKNVETNTGHMSKSPWSTKPNYADSSGGGTLRTDTDGQAPEVGKFDGRYNVSTQGA